MFLISFLLFEVMIISTAGEYIEVNSKNQKTKLPVLLRIHEFASRVLPRSIKKLISHMPHIINPILKKITSSAPSSLTEVVVSSGILQGIRLKLNLKTERYYWLDNYEHQLMRAILDFCKPGITVYDLGAHIGYTSIAFARIAGNEGEVYAFEPFPENVQRIAEHIALNSLEDIIHLVPCAVSDNEGQEKFLVYDTNILGRLDQSFYEDDYINKIEVRSLRLDDFVYRDGNPSPDLIKMDIEGGGVKAIPGMLRVLKEARPIFFMELHGPEERQVAWDILKQNQYNICKMQKGYPKISNLENLKWRGYIVAIP